MIDHMGLNTGDVARAKRFFEQALAPLGIGVQMAVTVEQTGSYEGYGFGRNGQPAFWIGGPATAHSGVHIAFTASTRAEVDAFHAAALAAGGRDNGAPGIRAHYHPNYYGAFVFDPDGNNIEAVCHRPE
jgi:catechol 2,3-dioxygenase-like lactoylglutathione lyase family enzyme